jgi:hypothetical protein
MRTIKPANGERGTLLAVANTARSRLSQRSKTHREAAPLPTQRQLGPQDPSLQVPAGQPTVEAHPELTPSGLMQVQPGPHEPTVHDAVEQTPVARQRRLPPPVSRHEPAGPHDRGVQAPDVGGGGGVPWDVGMQVPFWHCPPFSHAVPFSFLPLHLPCFFFRHGEHDFFFFLFFLAVVSTRPRRPSVPPSSAVSAPRRERSSVRARMNVSNR